MRQPHSDYPRPQFVRDHFQIWNGTWEFAFDDEDAGMKRGLWRGKTPLPLRIEVPFSYQYPASGINDKAIHDITWYRRTFTIEKENAGKRALLCFNASDYETDVWVNGIHAINHKGGFAPFSVDITDYLNGAKNVLVVRCYDGLETAVPRGKQHWEGITYGCFYYPNSGIWQSVWLEFFGQDCIDCLVADREFIGKEWIGWLNSRRIRYYIRIRQNFRIVKPSTGERIRAWWLFNDLRVGHEKFYHKLFLHRGEYVYLAGSRIKNSDGIPELQILICFNRPEGAVLTYKKRREIETAFRAMKSSGFNIEDRTPTCVTECVSHVCLRWSAWLLYGRISLVNIKIYTLNR